MIDGNVLHLTRHLLPLMIDSHTNTHIYTDSRIHNHFLLHNKLLSESNSNKKKRIE